MANPGASEDLADRQRLKLSFSTLHDQPRHADYSTVHFCHPDVLCPDVLQMLIEQQARILAANVGAVVDLAMPLTEFYPQRTAGIQIAGLVMANRGRGRIVAHSISPHRIWFCVSEPYSTKIIGRAGPCAG